MARKAITIALAGNPNSGKTTIFNNITGSVKLGRFDCKMERPTDNSHLVKPSCIERLVDRLVINKPIQNCEQSQRKTRTELS